MGWSQPMNKDRYGWIQRAEVCETRLEPLVLVGASHARPWSSCQGVVFIYTQNNRKPPKDFKQRSDVIRYILSVQRVPLAGEKRRDWKKGRVTEGRPEGRLS